MVQYHPEALGEALRTTRGARSLREIAPEMEGVSVSTLSRLERGATPDVDTLIKVCEWLGRPMSDFIRKAGPLLPEELEKAVKLKRMQINGLHAQAHELVLKAKNMEVHISTSISMFEKTGDERWSISYLRDPNQK